ncbi:hypothetical protein [Bartonella gliris]|nr:hypothetical protein [Bartonella gliris]
MKLGEKEQGEKAVLGRFLSHSLDEMKVKEVFSDAVVQAKL